MSAVRRSPDSISCASFAALLGVASIPARFNIFANALYILFSNACNLVGFFLTIFAPSCPIAVAKTSLSSASPFKSGYACATFAYKSVSRNSLRAEATVGSDTPNRSM